MMLPLHYAGQLMQGRPEFLPPLPRTRPCTPPAGQPALTSRISLILQPPFPIREPHWLAGTTSRRVTGGRLAAVLLVMELLMSCEEEELLRGTRLMQDPHTRGSGFVCLFQADTRTSQIPFFRALLTCWNQHSHVFEVKAAQTPWLCCIGELGFLIPTSPMQRHGVKPQPNGNQLC